VLGQQEHVGEQEHRTHCTAPPATSHHH
jgi:hypothetical protein